VGLKLFKEDFSNSIDPSKNRTKVGLKQLLPLPLGSKRFGKNRTKVGLKPFCPVVGLKSTDVDQPRNLAKSVTVE